MAVAYIQSGSISNILDTLPSLKMSMQGSSSITTGNLLVLGINHQIASMSVNDNNHNVWTCGVSSSDVGSNQQTSMWFAKNITGGGVAGVTASWVPDSAFITMVVTEYSGLDTTAPFATGSSRNGITGTNVLNAVVSPQITLTNNPSWIVGCAVDNIGSAVITAGYSHILRKSLEVSGQGTAIEDRQSSGSTASASFSFSVAQTYGASIIAFKLASAAAPSVGTLGSFITTGLYQTVGLKSITVD